VIVASLLLASTLSPFEQVVESERAFAAASLATGLHEAFLANLAKDAIIFDPLPASGRAAHEGKPKATGRLSWGPSWVAVSSAGDLALSTGPWEFRSTEEPAKKPSTGYFFSIWRRQADETWKVAVDAGVSSPLQFAIPKTVANGLPGAPAKAKRPADAANARIGVTTAERALAAAAKAGLGQAILAQVDPVVRIYRDGNTVAVGSRAARALLATDKRSVTCAPDQITASASGELGYAYGTCTGVGSDSAKHGFLRVWRKQADGTWKIMTDVMP
jgi:ketosteroid isomerase-like protein